MTHSVQWQKNKRGGESVSDWYKLVILLHLFGPEPANWLLYAVLPLHLSRVHTAENCWRGLCWKTAFHPQCHKAGHVSRSSNSQGCLYILCITCLGPKSSFTPTESCKDINWINCLQKIGFCHFLTHLFCTPLNFPTLPSFLQLYAVRVGKDAF